MEWINCKIRKPEGKVFWALTEGRNEQGHCDWVIRKMWNDDHGDYRSLDYTTSYQLPDTYNGQCWDSTIYAWANLDEIPINDVEY